MAAQLTQLMEALATVKLTLDAGNLNEDVFAQVMKTIVESTGTALNVIKTSFDVQDVKASETTMQMNLLSNTASVQGTMLQNNQHQLADMRQKIVNTPQTHAPKTFNVLDSKAIANMKTFKDDKASSEHGMNSL